MLFVAHLTSFDIQNEKKSKEMKFPHYSFFSYNMITYILDQTLKS